MGDPQNSWFMLVYNKTFKYKHSYIEMNDLGVPPPFLEEPWLYPVPIVCTCFY